jgi:hypothetical protein
MHLQDDEAYSVIEETLTNICKVLIRWHFLLYNMMHLDSCTGKHASSLFLLFINAVRF